MNVDIVQFHSIDAGSAGIYGIYALAGAATIFQSQNRTECSTLQQIHVVQP